jgi:hypothetical protein
MGDSAETFDGFFDDGGDAGALRSTASSSSRIWKELFFSMSSSLVFSSPAHECNESELIVHNQLIICTGGGHTQANFHDRLPGLFRLHQSSIDVYANGGVVVRDSRKFLFCEMSGRGKGKDVSQGHTHTHTHTRI